VGGGGSGNYSGATVWIIDSGVDNASNAINLDANVGANCRVNPCQVGQGFGDRLGHGTMIAGIIAAKPGGAGVYGVAPNAKVVPVKIFGRNGQAKLSGAPLRGLNYMFDYFESFPPTGTVVVNISWGADWIQDLRKNFLETSEFIRERLHDLADRGVQVVIAAGNSDPEDRRPNWVQFVMPAVAGSYVGKRLDGTPSGGHVYTVSAVQSTQQINLTWRDEWWNGSNYGNGPPDFAEPGVSVKSLWPRVRGTTRNQLNSCSGTSFAAPHLAGILLRGLVQTDGVAQNDPTSPPDPVGVLTTPTIQCEVW
jgi:subtilisin family serine protease